MYINKQLLTLILILHLIFHTGFAGVLLKSFENCYPNVNNVFNCNVTIKTVNKEQYLNGVVLFQRQLDNDIKVQATVEMLSGKKYLYLFTIRENKACDAMHKYLGEFAYDIERKVGLIPHMCPIPKNTYRFYNIPIDCNKITTVSNFPFGYLRITLDMFDNKNNVSCINFEVENNIPHL